VLKVNFVGYKEQQVDVYDNSEPVTIELSEAVDLLQEVVVVGYGVQKRQELTSAIATVDKELLKQNVPSVESALAGAVAGLNVSVTSGQPGAASTIRIRGGNSINGGNEPLYVIDGFIVYNDVTATRTDAGGSDASLDPLAFLNPADIESIEILKDVSATAIYGTRGANGVIMITTKKGKKGKDNINYQSTFGWQQIRKKMEFLNAREWTELYNEIRESEGTPELKLALPADEDGYDWQDAALRTGFTQEHQLSVVGGDERTRYSISGNYKSQEGIIKGTDLKRYAGRASIDRELLDRLKVGINVSGAYSQLNGLRNVNGNNDPNTWISAASSIPIVPIYDANGEYNYTPNELSTVTYNGKITNPISDLENTKTLTENTRVLSIAYAEYQPIQDLTLKANVGLDLSNTRQSNYAPSYTSSGASLGGVASIGHKSVYTWQTEYTANYSHVFADKHSFAALVGFTSQRTDKRGSSASSYGFTNDATGYNSLGSASNVNWPTSESYTSTLNSWLGRVNYSYDQRYNATVTLRADGSSRFAKGHQWGYFPSVGLSWNVDKERFFHGGKDFSYLKLRASAGVVGNQEIGDYKYIANIVPETYYFNDQAVTAYVVDNMANPDLKWETTASYNVGVDLGLFDGRLNFTLDAYYKKTSDLLLEVPVENVTGFSSALRNIGSVSNKGLEFEVNGTIVDRKNWKWRASANLATNTNKVESLGDADYFLPSFEGIGTLQYMTPLIVKRGEPLGTFYGYKFAGIVQADEDISKLPTQTTEALAPGVVKYQDVNGDGVVNEEDRTTLGNSQPKFTGGFNTTLNYRHWDLFISLHGSYGNKLFNTLRARFEKTSTAYNSLKSVANRWTESNPSNLIGKASNSTSIVTDDRYVEDASFLKVRNIALGYTLPVKSLTPDAKIRLFVSLQNFFTFTGYKGYDPESNRNGVDESNGLYQGVDFGTYPSAKTVQLGFSLTL
jgi:TonB-linked SusC/RagA family outer membrane protein